MSNLQIGLIGLGVLIIALVLAFNWWQDRRARERMQAHFPASEHDPLLGAGEASPAEGRREPGMAASRYDTSDDEAVAAAPEAHDMEETDDGSEVVIDLALAGSIRGADLIPMLQGLRSAGRKPIRVFAESDRGRHAARLRSDESYVSLQLAVLLANRSGPLTAIEWSQAWGRAQDLAERLEATVEGPDQQAVLDRAARLDDTCAALDTQVGLTVLLGAAQPVDTVLRAARDIGFADLDGRLGWLSDEGIARFTLSRGDGQPFEGGPGTVERLSLLLDVPCSPPDDQPFGRMVKVGRELAARLRADLVDDQGRPLHDGAHAGIDERLQVLYTQLEQAGLRAASPRAQRVFS